MPLDTPNESQAARYRAEAFAKQHLPECAAELLEWKDTSVLASNGRVRQLAKICAEYTGPSYSLGVAESTIFRAALESLSGCSDGMTIQEQIIESFSGNTSNGHIESFIFLPGTTWRPTSDPLDLEVQVFLSHVMKEPIRVGSCNFRTEALAGLADDPVAKRVQARNMAAALRRLADELDQI